MAHSNADTVEEYLAELPEERRKTAETIRKLILENLPEGYEEAMNWGMICYQVPFSRYPDTYNGQALMYAALAAQKNKFSLYLSNVYQNEEKKAHLQEAFEDKGKKADMGKSCVRFRKASDLPLDTIAELIRGTPVDTFIKEYEESRAKSHKAKS